MISECFERRFDYRTDNKKKNRAAIFVFRQSDLPPFKILGRKCDIQRKGTGTSDKEVIRTQASLASGFMSSESSCLSVRPSFKPEQSSGRSRSASQAVMEQQFQRQRFHVCEALQDRQMVGAVLPHLESWQPPEPAVTWCQPHGASRGWFPFPEASCGTPLGSMVHLPLPKVNLEVTGLVNRFAAVLYCGLVFSEALIDQD